MKKKIAFVILNFVFLIFFSCAVSSKKETDSPTSGNIYIACDATVEPFAKSEISAFEGIYPNTKIHLISTTEDSAFALLLSDSVRMIFASRETNEEEKKLYTQKKMQPKIMHVVADAVAFIVNEKLPDTISNSVLQKMIRGEIISWKEWNKNLPDERINLVFDNSNSSTVRYIKNKTEKLGKNISALKSNQAVIEYIKKNVSSIGIIGLNWISDGRDKTTGSFYTNFHVMGIYNDLITSNSDKIEKKIYYKPFQAYMLQGNYPYTRTIYSVNGEPRNGLGTGFVSFVSSNKGQIVAQQGGLLPLSQKTWIKTVEIKKNLEE